MHEREVKKKAALGRVIPTRKLVDRAAVAKARILRRGLRIPVPENAKVAKKEGGKAEVAFSLFGALMGLFSFMNEKLGAGIPAFDEKKGNVKIATNRINNVTIADNRNTVTLDVGGRSTTCKVNKQAPIKL